MGRERKATLLIDGTTTRAGGTHRRLARTALTPLVDLAVPIHEQRLPQRSPLVGHLVEQLRALYRGGDHGH